jgi:hypothetical protein
MNKSKILIFLLAILMIVSISAVSAADIADSDDFGNSFLYASRGRGRYRVPAET